MNPAEVNERSYGVVPFTVRDGALHVFVIQHHSGAWLFPKGRAEGTETALQTAERELGEETGLCIERWLITEPFIERYRFWRGQQKIYKEAQYFPALVYGSIVLQSAEVKAGQWEPVTVAERLISFSEMRNLLHQILDQLHTKEPLLFSKI
jgi:8-oxo-dGTP pyrophosphatase MutT (NUDIX family)